MQYYSHNRDIQLWILGKETNGSTFCNKIIQVGFTIYFKHIFVQYAYFILIFYTNQLVIFINYTKWTQFVTWQFIVIIFHRVHFFNTSVYIFPVILTGFFLRKFNAAAFRLHSGSQVLLE